MENVGSVIGATLTVAQRRFFDQFGYLRLPGLLSDRRVDLVGAFDDAFPSVNTFDDLSRQPSSEAFSRVHAFSFVEDSPSLKDLPVDGPLGDLAAALLGPDFVYLGSGGQVYGGDTPWHVDNIWPEARFIKVAIYLEDLDRTTGALRVVAGSHLQDWTGYEDGKVFDSDDLWGVSPDSVPAISLDSRPDDVLVFDQRLLHAAFHGGLRRMLHLSYCSAPTTDGALADLQRFISHYAIYYRRDHVFSDVYANSVGPRLRRAIQPVLDHQRVLPDLLAATKVPDASS